MRVVYFGSPAFAVPSLLALRQAGFPVAAVVTQPDRPRGRGLVAAASPVAEAALSHELKVLRPERLDAGLVAELESLAADVLVVVAYGKILRRPLLELTRFGALNVHASLLPRHRGASPITAAILAGDEQTGVTTMRMDEGLDTGPMLLAESLRIGPEETAGELGLRLAELGAALLVRTLHGLARGEIVATPQDESQASYAPKLDASAGLVDWSLPAEQIGRQVRAFQPWPGARTRLPDGKSLKLLRVHVLGEASAKPPGAVIRADLDAIVVACGTGTLAIDQAQPEGRRPLRARELINGRRIGTGDRLGA